MRKPFLSGIACILILFSQSQELKELIFDNDHRITGVKTQGQSFSLSLPFFSLEINKKLRYSNEPVEQNINLLIEPDPAFKEGYKAKLEFTNNGNTPASISNIIPFGVANT